MNGLQTKGRMKLVARVLFGALVVVLLRVVELVVMERDGLVALAAKQQRRQLTLPPERGPVVDRDGNALALTVESAAIFADPQLARLDSHAIQALSRALDLDPRQVAERMQTTSHFVYLRRNATPRQAEAVAELGLAGIGSQPSRTRVYPWGTVAGQVVGFSGIEGKGLEGIERAYDAYLEGSSESVVIERDARGRYLLPQVWQPKARQGARVELTIDANLQRVVENELENAVFDHRAEGGFALVMDPNSGELLALANAPLFDPNRFDSMAAETRRNRTASFRYEPGSTFKSILAAAAIEAGVVWPDKRIFCENGNYAVGTRVIHDHDPYGTLTFADVIKYSSNIGAAKVAESLGAERFRTTIEAFGFGQPTGVDLPSEVGGALRPLSEWRRINLVTTSYGHGISVTPIQLARAYAALANGGKLVRPYVVRRVVSPEGEVLVENRPKVVGVPISARTSEVVTAMLREVVTSGTGTQAAIESVAVAGKTGTTKKLDPRGGYSKRDYIASFVGYFPADKPKYLMLVVIDTPRTGGIYGGVVAGPVFRHVGEYIADRDDLRTPATPPSLPPIPGSSLQLVNWSEPEVDGMPSYIGMPLREALREAARAGWQVETSGSGFVRAQDPPPGAKTAKGCRLLLQLDSGVG